MPELGSMWNFLCRYLMTPYPFMEWLFFKCLRIIMSMKFWIIRRLRESAVLDFKVKTDSKCVNVLEYNSMCLWGYSHT